MAKLTKSQICKANELARVLRSFDFIDVRVNLDSKWIVTGKRDFISSSVISCIPKNWSFYFDGVELDICIF